MLSRFSTPVRGAFHEARQGEAAESADAQENRGLPSSEVGHHGDEIVDAALPERFGRSLDGRYRLPDVWGGLWKDALDAFGDGIQSLRHLIDLLRYGGFLLVDDAARRILRLSGQSGSHGLRLVFHV